MSTSHFDALFFPYSREEFLKGYFEKKHLHIKSEDSNRFVKLASFSAIDKILGTFGLNIPDIRVVNAEKKIEEADYIWKDRMVDPAKVARLFSSGSSIIFNSFQDRLEALRSFCSDVSGELNLRTQTNLYLTPPNSQGFITHWDTHDVFVLQVEGRKKWSIYAEKFPLPFDDTKHQFERDTIEAEEVIDEFYLEEGDVLYIPRGVMHSAKADNVKSLHITFGIIAYTWSHLVADCLQSISDKSEQWRESVPLFMDDNSSSYKDLSRALSEKFESLQQNIDLKSIMLGQKNKALKPYRPRVENLLEQVVNSNQIDLQDQISPYNNTVEISLSEDAERIYLTDHLREVSFPASAKKTIDQIFGEGGNIRVSEFDDDIDTESRKLVISSLMNEGFIYKH